MNLKAYMQGYFYKQAVSLEDIQDNIAGGDQLELNKKELQNRYDSQVKEISKTFKNQPADLKQMLKSIEAKFNKEMAEINKQITDREKSGPDKQTTQALKAKKTLADAEQGKQKALQAAEQGKQKALQAAEQGKQKALQAAEQGKQKALQAAEQGKQKALQAATAPGASAKRLLDTYGKPAGIGAGIGATVGGGASVAYDKANDKPVNLSRAALLALLGGAAGGAGGVMYANSQMK